MAGAQVILTDLSHITPLTVHNLKVNCGDHQQHSKVSLNQMLGRTRKLYCIFQQLNGLF